MNPTAACCTNSPLSVVSVDTIKIGNIVSPLKEASDASALPVCSMEEHHRAGLAHQEAGRCSAALQQYRRALHCRGHGNWELTGRILVDIATVQTELGNVFAAQQALMIALEIRQRLGKEVASTLCALASVDKEHAMECLTEALLHATDDEMKAKIWNDMACHHDSVGNTTDAESCRKEVRLLLS